MATEMKISDESLKAISLRIADDDQHSFRILFHHFSGRLTAFAYSIIGSKEAATEVVDDVWVRIWKNRATISQIKNLRVYLYAATKNTALNYLSRTAKAMVTEPFNDINVQLRDEHCPEQQMITEEVFSKIHAAVQALPPRAKIIFKLVREDGLKYREVAEILKISENTVDTQMVIAVKRIKQAIGSSFSFRSGHILKKN